MSELLDRIKEVQAQVHCSTLEAKELLEQAGGDVDVAVAIYHDNHPTPVTPTPTQTPRPVNNNVQPPRNNPEPPRRRRRLWWIPLVAVSSFLLVVGGAVAFAVIYGNSIHSWLTTSSSKRTYGSSSKKATTSGTCTSYKKPGKEALLAYISDYIKNTGDFSPISGTAYVEVEQSSINNMFYDWTASLGVWTISVDYVQVKPKSYGYVVSGTLDASGNVDCSGNYSLMHLEVAGVTVVAW